MNPTGIATGAYGTTGLPKFGGTVGHEKAAGITAINESFNGLVNTVKANATPGNDMLLWFFGVQVKALYAIAEYCILGKPVING